MNKRIKIIFTFLFVCVFAVFLFDTAKAAAVDNVWGWAWSENIGWISFNCYNDYDGDGSLESHCTDMGYFSDYGVNVDPSTGLFSGYAWSENIGWISFSTTTLTGCPSGACEAKLDFGTKDVSGWARALAASSTNSGGWDGWIRLRDTNYGVYWIPGSQVFKGWAVGWDDSSSTAVIGWISFNCDNPELPAPRCVNSDYKVFTSFNPIPNVSSLTSSFDAPCLQSRIPTLSWNTNASMPYDYEIQICSNSTCTGGGDPLVNETVLNTFSTSWAPACNYCCDVAPYNSIAFGGGTYYWRVSARNTGGEWSNWKYDSFTTKAHCYPFIDFDWTPGNPTVGGVVNFTDNSTVYGGATKSSWLWEFQDGNPASSIVQDATTTFSSTGSKTVRLTVTDSDTFSCTGQKTLNIQRRPPKWKEIPPF